MDHTMISGRLQEPDLCSVGMPVFDRSAFGDLSQWDLQQGLSNCC